MLDLLGRNQMKILTGIERDICLRLDSDDRVRLANLQLEIRQITAVARMGGAPLLGKTLNPGGVTLIEKSPEGKPVKENRPALLLLLVRWSPVAWFVRTTEAFGMIAPLESCTVPEIVPLITWAKVDGMKVLMTADVSRHAKTKGIRKKFDFRIFSCVVVLSLINFSNFTTLLSLCPKTLRLWRLFRRKPMAVRGITSPW